jgi:hypothetical protein
MLEGVFQRRRTTQDLAGGDGISGPAGGAPGRPGDLGGVVDPAGQCGDPEGGQSLRPHVGRQQLAGIGRTQQLRLEVGVGLLELRDGLVDMTELHACNSDDGV